MSMDATIDSLVDTCVRNGMNKQALGPMGSRLTAGAVLALAGGAVGAGAGYMYDRGRSDPDESAAARSRKMKQRMLSGAGIGAAAGGLGGMLLAAPGPRPLEAHERQQAITDGIGPAIRGGAQEAATIKEVAGVPVNTGAFALGWRTLKDMTPVVGPGLDPALQIPESLVGPAYVHPTRENILRNTGMRNYLTAIKVRNPTSTPIRTTLSEASRFIGLPGRVNYRELLATDYKGIVPEVARTKILQAILARQPIVQNGKVINPNNGAKPGLVHVPRGTPEQLEARMPRVAKSLRKGNVGPYGDIVEHQMRNGPGVDAKGNPISGVGPSREFHAGQVGWKGALKGTWKPGSTAADLKIGRRMLFAGILTNMGARFVNNMVMNGRTRNMAEEIAKKLVVR